MTTPIQLNYSITPPRACREHGESQAGTAFAPADQCRSEPNLVPDYLALIEAELKAFQQELHHLQTVLDARKESVRRWR